MRLPNGYGSISKLKGKRRNPYCVRTAGKSSLTAEGKTRENRHVLGYYPTKKAALDALAEYNANPYDLSAAKLTFGDVYKMWSENKFERISKQSAASYEASYKRCAPLHNIYFEDLNLLHLQTLMDTMADKSKSSANNLKILFSALYDFAIKHDIVSRDYSQYVEMTYKNSAEPIHKAITEQEISELWEHADDDITAMILILIYSGWRISELLNLEKIDLSEMIMQGGLKTEAGKHRIVPIHHRIQPLVKRLYKNGKIYERSYESFKRNFYKAMPGHKIHDTRHTFISRLQSAGADHVCIERLAGHASKGVTDKIYTHKSINELRKTIEMLE